MKSFTTIKIFFVVFFLIAQITACNVKDKDKNINNQTVKKKNDILELERTIRLPGIKGRIDHMAIDVKSQVLFITALGNNSVETVDLLKGESFNSVKDIEEPQGILFIPENNVLCVSSGGTGDCNFYDAKTFGFLSKVKLGTDADNLRFDPVKKLIYVGYGEGAIAIVDAEKYSIQSKIDLSGHPESFQLDKKNNKIYVNVPDSKLIEVALLDNNSVNNKISLKNAEANFPMDLDTVNDLILIGCRKPAELIVYDTKSSNEITRFEIRKDADDIFFDAKNKFIYISCGEGYLQVFKQEKKEVYNLSQEILTRKGARTSLYVPELNKMYLAVPRNDEEEAVIQIYSILS